MNTKDIGEKSEGLILAKFLTLGWVVLMPFGDNQRYDFVIDRGCGFERIQVKTARLINGAIEFRTCSSQNHRGRGTFNYKGQCDYFAAYCTDNKKMYMIKVNDCGDTGVKLRIEPPKNNQKEKIRLACEFEI